MGTCSHH